MCRRTSGCKTSPATCSRATSPAASSAPPTPRCASATTSTIPPHPASASRRWTRRRTCRPSGCWRGATCSPPWSRPPLRCGTPRPEHRWTVSRSGPLGQNLLLARRLVEAGVRLVSVTAWTGLPAGEKFRNVQTWDMHGDGAGLGSIFGTGHFGLGWALPRVDEAVSALLEDLALRGLLETTLVVMVGEFGRSPKVSQAGRDHWPACYSALLAGGGIRGGLVHGSSDRSGAYVRD